jgi:hypothetical protein
MSQELINVLVFVFVFIVVPWGFISGFACSGVVGATRASSLRRRSRRRTGRCGAG